MVVAFPYLSSARLWYYFWDAAFLSYMREWMIKHRDESGMSRKFEIIINLTFRIMYLKITISNLQ